MTDKATIQPKSKPEKTTISISGETSERLEIYCRANGILRKEFVSLALEYFERTGFDLKSNALDYSPLEKIIGELNEVKATMQTSNEGTEAIRQYDPGHTRLARIETGGLYRCHDCRRHLCAEISGQKRAAGHER